MRKLPIDRNLYLAIQIGIFVTIAVLCCAAWDIGVEAFTVCTICTSLLLVALAVYLSETYDPHH